MAIIAFLIKLESRGPVIFRQRRVGQGGSEFDMLKFRTMRVGLSGPSVTVEGDPRITRTGTWLRSVKLDELPQLYNVLRGDMSLVGPRPEIPQYVAHWPPEDRRRILSVRPGITDPAAIEFRRESEILARSPDPARAYVDEVLPQKVKMYVAYVESRTFLGDLRLIISTIRVLLTGRRADA